MSNHRLVSLVHLGCARNLIDSELILARMAEEGLTITDDVGSAHTVVLNTCSFIGLAREESEGALRGLLERKQRGDLRGVVVAGCLVQRYKRRLREQYPAVDFFAEISDYGSLARSVRDLVDGRKVPAYLEAGGLRDAEREGARLISTPRSYAYLRISHGCDHTCSFCAIPSIRGPHRSKRLPAVLAEAEELVAGGARELVLVAEDSTAWGREMGLDLSDLVGAVADVEGLARLRVMYAYPNRFPWRLTELLREHPVVLPYLDIPIQHASTPVLRAMRRAGSGDQVRAILDRLLEEVPGLTLRTTVLLGFPGETDADVEELVRLVDDYRLARLGAFAYSHEEGTPAFDADAPHVPPEVAEARCRAVLDARDANLETFQDELVGTEVEVLVDEAARGGGAAVGRGPMDAPEVDLVARVEGCDAEPGALVATEVVGLDEELNLICRVL